MRRLGFGCAHASTPPTITPAAMCRYVTHDYKSHFVCFDCRKAFKKAPLPDWARQRGLDSACHQLASARGARARPQVEQRVGTTYDQLRATYLHEVGTCPQCRAPMAAMGLDFRAPKRADLEAWEIIRQLHAFGFAFVGCGCSVGYLPPTRLREVPDFLRHHQRPTEAEQLLARLASTSARRNSSS
ncbi:MAG: hypothetical protein JSR82_06480 [Verrucomicrobia bacterium]|nr:hypothetical protein [Verrucomicrobiota bacterium]